jgi:hypothetical protein
MQIAFYFNYVNQSVVLEDLIKINEAINFVYENIQYSITIKIIIPPNSIIVINKNGTISFRPALDALLSNQYKKFLSDPNNLILNISSSHIIYNLAFDKNFQIVNNINYISFLYFNPKIIYISISK